MGAQKANAEALSFVEKMNTIIVFPLITLLSAIAFLVFLWGCAEYIIHADNQTARQKGVQHITWGIIGLVVMITAWAILSLAAGTFGLQDRLDCAKEGTCDYSVPIPK